MNEIDWYKRLYAYIFSNDLGISHEQKERVMSYAARAADVDENAVGSFTIDGQFDDSREYPITFMRPVLEVPSRPTFRVFRGAGKITSVSEMKRMAKGKKESNQ